MSNPYHGLDNYHFWRRSVSSVERHLLDPVIKPRFQIERAAKVATAGSCFAQHISRRLREINFNYFIPEAGEHLPEGDRMRNNYGVFSARFGNIYTTAQLLQLFLEAFGERQPEDKAWRRPDGRYVDPFRQQVEPNGFDSIDAVAEDRQAHLSAVRTMFLESDVFIFTLGLTEAWRSKVDGSVFPLAPGVAAHEYLSLTHEFVNFGVTQAFTDLDRFMGKLKAVNPNVRVLLTVSPVPLIATFEDRHVLTSTTYSKSVLRVVAEEIIQKYDWADYFPSYEIITGSYAGGAYYEDDFREVNKFGVAHAMRCFLNNYVNGQTPNRVDNGPLNAAINIMPPTNIVCDEEMIEAMRPR
jgi:hypothetical protein